jgi:hypothetical protein
MTLTPNKLEFFLMFYPLQLSFHNVLRSFYEYDVWIETRMISIQSTTKQDV